MSWAKDSRPVLTSVTYRMRRKGKREERSERERKGRRGGRELDETFKSGRVQHPTSPSSN